MALTMTESVRNTLQVNLFQNVRRTRAEYRNSFGNVARTFGSWTLWHVIDVVNSTWEELFPKLEIYLDQNDHKIEYPINHQGARDLRPTLRCYLVGRGKDRASPHIACLSNYKWYRKAIKQQILQSSYLQDVGWEGVLGLPGVRYPARLDHSGDEVSKPPALTDFEVYLSDDCSKYSLCGAQAGIFSAGMLVHTVTIGGVVMLDDMPFALTAGHAFLTSDHNSSDQSSEQLGEMEWDLDEDDLDPFLFDNHDFDAPTHKAILPQRPKQNPEPKSHEWSTMLGSSDHLWAMGCDWMLLRLHVVLDHQLKSRCNLVKRPLRTGFLHVESAAESMSEEGTGILLSTSHSSMQGYGHTSKTSLGMSAWGMARTVWTISLDRIEDGDCGAWAIDARTHELLGILVAVSDLMSEAYILPIRDVWADIQNVTGKIPELPGWDKILSHDDDRSQSRSSYVSSSQISEPAEADERSKLHSSVVGHLDTVTSTSNPDEPRGYQAILKETVLKPKEGARKEKVQNEGVNISEETGPISSTSDVEPRLTALDLDKKTLTIEGLEPFVTEEVLKEVFEITGYVQKVRLIMNKHMNHELSDLNCAFVEYEDPLAAEEAVYALNRRLIGKTMIRVAWTYRSNDTNISKPLRIFVGNLSTEVNDEILLRAFSTFRSISGARVMCDRMSGRSRGYGIISFRHHRDVEKALTSMDNEWLGSRNICCRWIKQDCQKSATIGMNYETIIAESPEVHTTCYVGNFTPWTTEHEIATLFQNFGSILMTRFYVDNGFAYISMDTHENAAMAICQLDGHQVNGRYLECSWGSISTRQPASIGISEPLLHPSNFSVINTGEAAARPSQSRHRRRDSYPARAACLEESIGNQGHHCFFPGCNRAYEKPRTYREHLMLAHGMNGMDAFAKAHEIFGIATDPSHQPGAMEHMGDSLSRPHLPEINESQPASTDEPFQILHGFGSSLVLD